MTLMIDSNINKTTDGKYHIVLIYRVHDDGSYGGGYYEPSVDLMGGIGGDSINKMVNEAYESLEQATEVVGDVPFDIYHIKDSIAFDLVECYTEDEMDTAHTLLYKGTSFEMINNAVLE